MKALIDGNITEITSTEWDEFQAYKKSQAKDWPQNGDVYYWINNYGQVFHRAYVDEYAISHHAIGNIYRTEAEAQAKVEKLKAEARIRKYIKDNGLEFVPDWTDRGQEKYHIIASVAQGTTGCELERQIDRGYLFTFKTADDAHCVRRNCTDDLKTLFGI